MTIKVQENDKDLFVIMSQIKIQASEKALGSEWNECLNVPYHKSLVAASLII